MTAPDSAAPALSRQAAPPRAAVPEATWASLVVVLAATFVSTIDFFIVNVAIPSMSVSLHASAGQIQWVVAGFALAVGAGVITAGRLGDLYGRRRLFVLGLALFTVSSAGCGLAPSPGTLVGARIAQGLAAAVMTPQVLAIISATYTGSKLARAFTAYGLSMGLAAVTGQLIGGALIQADPFGLGWRMCFLINVPIGVVALPAAFRAIGESRGARTALDLAGVAMVTAALVALVLPLIQGRAAGWPEWTWASFGLSALLFAVFVAYQRRLAAGTRAPLIDPAVFRDRAFAVGIVAQLAAFLGQASFFLVLAVYLQDGRGLSALTSGLIFTVIGAGYIATSLTSGAVVAKLGKQVVPLGAALMVAGLALMALAAGSRGGVGWLLPGLALDGAGMGMVITPMAGIVLAGVQLRHAGAASGVLSTVTQVGAALGVAIIGIAFYGASSIRIGFMTSLVALMGVEVAVMIVMQFLPTTPRTDQS